jgi:hypothetical protein
MPSWHETQLPLPGQAGNNGIKNAKSLVSFGDGHFIRLRPWPGPEEWLLHGMAVASEKHAAAYAALTWNSGIDLIPDCY